MAEETSTPKGDLADTANAEGQAQKADGAPEASDPAKTAERLLEESKKFKARAQAAETELEKLRKQKLQDEKKYEELWKAEAAKVQTLTRNNMKRTIETQVSGVASKAGCVNVEALMKLGNGDLLTYDESTDSCEGVEAFVEDAKRTHPYLFQAQRTAVINPATPGGGPAKPKTATASDIAKMAGKQKEDLWARALSAKAKELKLQR